MLKDLSLDNPLAIIGDQDAVLGFKALGFNAYPLKEIQEFNTILEEILKQKPVVCLVQDNIYVLAQEQINNYRNLPLPVFIPFTKNLKDRGLLENFIKDIRLRATGTI